MKYRPEIDGLRAIAVLAVVLYHAGIGRAGFVGVDVFFVISGYLITRLLLKERDATGRIDFAAFYARRVRRILPAATVVVLAVLVACYMLLPPEPQGHTYRAAGAAFAFVSNVFFQHTTGGYFDGRSEEMPLLHLWSLSVEEQFYLLWPAMILLASTHQLRNIMAAIALVSIALAEWWISQGSNAAFFEMPARFWELAAGGLIAASTFVAPRWLLPFGIMLALAACVIPMPHFPGIGAVPAVIGACAIIAGVHGGQHNRLLASRPIVGVGLISYSLYLWHWPLIALYRATSIGEVETRTKLLLCAVAMLLAAATYRYIEQPFRKMRFPASRTVMAGVAVSATIGLSACALGVRVERQQAAMADDPLAAATEHDMASRACHASGVDRTTLKCQPHSRTLIYGDSMAWGWLPAFSGASDVTMDACVPFVGYLPEKPYPGHYRCRDHNAAVVALPADMVVIGAYWQAYGDLAGMESTLDALDHVPRVLIIGPTPVMRDGVARCIRKHAEAACTITRREFDAKAKPILAQLRSIAAQHKNAEVIDVTDRFCTATQCPPLWKGSPLYWDDHHIAASAAARMAGTIR